MKNIKALFLIGIAAGFAACNNQPQNEAADLAVPVSVMDVKPQSIQQYINTTGTVRSTYETELTSQMAGDYELKTNPATGKPFKLGDKVKAGQVIIHLDDKEYINNINLEAKKLDLSISKSNYDKQKSLLAKGGVTESDLQNAQVQEINAQNAYEAAMINLAKMDVVAPFNGVIVDLPYYTPDVKVASGQSMVTLMSYDKMYMEINLPEKYVTEVKVGQKVLITNYTIAQDTLIGTISDLSPTISTETRTFTGNVSIDNPKLLLRPGMFVKADIITASKDSTIVIPKDIISTSNRGNYVFVVDRTNARQRRITTGLENQDNIEVTEGLNLHDQLVIKGFETLRNGSKVKILR